MSDMEGRRSMLSAVGVAKTYGSGTGLVRAVDGLIGPQGSPSVTGGDVGLTLGLALAVALLSTFIPALHAARTSTVSALAGAARRPCRRRMLIALSRRLPVPWLIGLRLAVRRPRRLALGAASTAITVALIVAVVDVHDRSQVSRVIEANNRAGSPVFPSAGALIAVWACAVAVVTALAALTSWLGTRRPAVAILQAELA